MFIQVTHFWDASSDPKTIFLNTDQIIYFTDTEGHLHAKSEIYCEYDWTGNRCDKSDENGFSDRDPYYVKETVEEIYNKIDYHKQKSNK